MVKQHFRLRQFGEFLYYDFFLTLESYGHLSGCKFQQECGTLRSF